MDDELIVQFTSITDTTPSQAEQYLRLTEGNLEQAIQLFFEDPNLATTAASASSSNPVPAPAPAAAPISTRKRKTYGEDEQGVIHIDSDDEEQDDSDDVQYVGEGTVAGHGMDT